MVLTVDPHVGASPANGNGSLTPRRSFLLHEGSTLGPIELGTTETCFIPTRLQPTLSCCWGVAISCNNIHRHWETSGAKLNRTLAHTHTDTYTIKRKRDSLGHTLHLTVVNSFQFGTVAIWITIRLSICVVLHQQTLLRCVSLLPPPLLCSWLVTCC